MTAPDQAAKAASKALAGGSRSLIASPLSMVFFVAAPGHGSLRGRNNPPQHLVRSTGAAMSTTSWHTMTPLKAHPRSPPYVARRATITSGISLGWILRTMGSGGACVLRPAERLS